MYHAKYVFTENNESKSSNYSEKSKNVESIFFVKKTSTIQLSVLLLYENEYIIYIIAIYL
jgi:hypothetical protein